MAYATTAQLAAILQIKKDIPSWDVGQSPTSYREVVGTGDSSTTLFYLDHKNILASSYTLYYGTVVTTSTTLTETTHYSLNKDTGCITLTSAGVTLLATNNIYAVYSYLSLDISESYLTILLARAEQIVNEKCNTIFTDGTAVNPAYPTKIDYLPSMGIFNTRFFTTKRPIVDVTTLLGADITAAATSLTVTADDEDKFPTSGTIIIESEVITYTGITPSTHTFTGLTRGVGDSTGAIHLSGVAIHSFIMEISGTQEGTTPTWYQMEHKVDMFVDDLGAVTLYHTNLVDDATGDNTLLPQLDVDNRIKLTYMYGYTTIPVSITRLTLLIAKQMLINDMVGKALIEGRNEFNVSDALRADDIEINAIVYAYRQLPMVNT